MKPHLAKKGDRLVRVACCAAGPVLVLDWKRPTWRCAACHSSGTDCGEVTL